MEFIEGRPLNTFFADRHPLLGADPDPEAVAVHGLGPARSTGGSRRRSRRCTRAASSSTTCTSSTSWSARRAVGRRLLDFEAAAPAEENGRQRRPPGLRRPGRPAGLRRRPLRPGLSAARAVPARHHPVRRGPGQSRASGRGDRGAVPGVPREFLDEAVAEITLRAVPHAARRPGGGARRARAGARAAAAVSALEPGTGRTAATRWSRRSWPRATPDATTGSSPATSPSSPTAADSASRTARPASCTPWRRPAPDRSTEAEEWLLDGTRPAASGTPLGFYDGLAGIAHVLDRLGHRRARPGPRRPILPRAVGRAWPRPAQRTGRHRPGPRRPGRPTGESALRDQAVETARPARRRSPTPQAAAGTPRAGLMHGATGPAAVPAAPVRGDRRHRAARPGRRRAPPGPGRLRRAEGRRAPGRRGLAAPCRTWATGSVGIGMVLDDYLATAPTRVRGGAGARSCTAAQANRSTPSPALFPARAGHGRCTCARTTTAGRGHRARPIARQIDALAWHADALPGAARLPRRQ